MLPALLFQSHFHLSYYHYFSLLPYSLSIPTSSSHFCVLYLIISYHFLLFLIISRYICLVDRKRRENELKVRKQRSETPYLYENGRDKGSAGGGQGSGPARAGSVSGSASSSSSTSFSTSSSGVGGRRASAGGRRGK